MISNHVNNFAIVPVLAVITSERSTKPLLCVASALLESYSVTLTQRVTCRNPNNCNSSELAPCSETIYFCVRTFVFYS